MDPVAACGSNRARGQPRPAPEQTGTHRALGVSGFGIHDALSPRKTAVKTVSTAGRPVGFRRWCAVSGHVSTTFLPKLGNYGLSKRHLDCSRVISRNTALSRSLSFQNDFSPVVGLVATLALEF